MKGRRATNGVGAGGRHGGAKRLQRNNFGPPWQKSCRRIRGGGYLEIASCSRIRRDVGGQVGKL